MVPCPTVRLMYVAVTGGQTNFLSYILHTYILHPYILHPYIHKVHAYILAYTHRTCMKLLPAMLSLGSARYSTILYCTVPLPNKGFKTKNKNKKVNLGPIAAQYYICRVLFYFPPFLAFPPPKESLISSWLAWIRKGTQNKYRDNNNNYTNNYNNTENMNERNKIKKKVWPVYSRASSLPHKFSTVPSGGVGGWSCDGGGKGERKVERGISSKNLISDHYRCILAGGAPAPPNGLHCSVLFCLVSHSATSTLPCCTWHHEMDGILFVRS